MRLRVSKDFFLQFASKTWLSPFSIIRELVEDAFDEDATRVIITLSSNYAVVEDDVGMDQDAIEKFLVVGSIHKQFEPVSPKLGRVRTGRYGTGRLSFLAFFRGIKLRTRKKGSVTSLLIDEDCIAGLANGQSQVKVIEEPPLTRDGNEIWLLEPKSKLDVKRIVKELRELPILREPFFEVWLRAGEFKPWSLEDAVRIGPPEILGEKIPVSIEGVAGEIIVANRPLSDEERGIAVLHGSHMAMKSLLGFSPSQMSRVTGWIRCDWLNVRFADKSAVIEDEAYERFKSLVRRFIASEVLPKAVEAREWLSYSEVQAFRKIDRILSLIVAETVEEATPAFEEPLPIEIPKPEKPETPLTEQPIQKPQTEPIVPVPVAQIPPAPQRMQAPAPQTPSQTSQSLFQALQPTTTQPTALKKPPPPPKRVRMRGLGFEVLPYADERDDRECFVDGKTIFINKRHPAYAKELGRGRDFLVRYVLRIIASVMASAECPEKTEALERANRLIAEALKRL